jgi:hypothetical protein
VTNQVANAMATALNQPQQPAASNTAHDSVIVSNNLILLQILLGLSPLRHPTPPDYLEVCVLLPFCNLRLCFILQRVLVEHLDQLSNPR